MGEWEWVSEGAGGVQGGRYQTSEGFISTVPKLIIVRVGAFSASFEIEISLHDLQTFGPLKTKKIANFINTPKRRVPDAAKRQTKR